MIDDDPQPSFFVKIRFLPRVELGDPFRITREGQFYISFRCRNFLGVLVEINFGVCLIRHITYVLGCVQLFFKNSSLLSYFT